MSGPLESLYHELNVRCWRGRLPPPIPRASDDGPPWSGVHLERVGSWALRSAAGAARLWGRFDPPRGPRPATIHVLHGLTADFEREVLGHEMAHLVVWLETGEPGAHNSRFCAELERLARLGEPWAADQAHRYRTDAARYDGLR